MNILTITNVEIFVWWSAATTVTVEEMSGGGRIIKKTSTAVFPQETISVPKLVSGHTMLTARQEYYFPGTNPAMVPVLDVQ